MLQLSVLQHKVLTVILPLPVFREPLRHCADGKQVLSSPTFDLPAKKRHVVMRKTQTHNPIDGPIETTKKETNLDFRVRK